MGLDLNTVKFESSKVELSENSKHRVSIENSQQKKGPIPIRTDMQSSYRKVLFLPMAVSYSTHKPCSRAVWSEAGSLLIAVIFLSHYLKGEQPRFTLCMGNRRSAFCLHRLCGSNYVSVVLLWIVSFDHTLRFNLKEYRPTLVPIKICLFATDQNMKYLQEN